MPADRERHENDVRPPRRRAAAYDGWADATPLLAGLGAAAVEGRVVLGVGVQRQGQPAEADAPLAPTGCHARANGFDLHARVVVPAGQRDRLERVCQYVMRPPVGAERGTLTPDGRVRLQLRHPWADGTTHLLFDPIAFLSRLAVLVPRPRVNLVLYHGVLAPRSAWRARIVPRTTTAQTAVAASHRRARGYQWADLLRRTFGVDVLACPWCGGRLRLIALIEQAAVIERMLRHLGLPTRVGRRRAGIHPARLNGDVCAVPAEVCSPGARRRPGSAHGSSSAFERAPV